VVCSGLLLTGQNKGADSRKAHKIKEVDEE